MLCNNNINNNQILNKNSWIHEQFSEIKKKSEAVKLINLCLILVSFPGMGYS